MTFPSSPSKRHPSSSPDPPFSLNLSQSSSPQDLSVLDLDDYLPIPDQHTIIHHPLYNLPSFGIIINVRLQCIICLKCERALNPENLISHVHKDVSSVEIPEELPGVLEKAFHLVPYSSIKFPSEPVTPIFGLSLNPTPMFFCDCGKGYSGYETLRAHQTRKERSCPLVTKNPGYHKGYAQRLTANRSFFEVDPRSWRIDFESRPNYSLAFGRSLPPLRDYSKMEIKGADDEMNTSSFFYSQRWLSLLEGYTPIEIQEVTVQSTPDVQYGELLRRLVEEFLKDSNSEIKNHNSFGILKLMGQLTE